MPAYRRRTVREKSGGNLAAVAGPQALAQHVGQTRPPAVPSETALMPEEAVVLANSAYATPNGKTAHGLIRHGTRFTVRAVVDPACAGADAGSILDGRSRGIPVVATLAEAVDASPVPVRHCIVGLATHGGRLTRELRGLLLQALELGLSIVNGLHDLAGDDPELAAMANARGLTILDLRRPKPRSDLHFWSGEVARLTIPRIAVLGTDCAIGKRTTAQLLTAALTQAGIRAELIYTGQTGWLQGGRYGFILDATVNDYVAGELEHALLSCARERSPEVMLLEGQSALRNPSGPCGAEFLRSALAGAVILQHAPERRFYHGYEHTGIPIPDPAEEIELLRIHGARTLAVTLHGDRGRDPAFRADLQHRLAVPVIHPLAQGADELAGLVRTYMETCR